MLIHIKLFEFMMMTSIHQGSSDNSELEYLARGFKFDYWAEYVLLNKFDLHLNILKK